MKKTARIVVILLLLATAFLGLTDGINQLRQTMTPLQHTVTIAVLVYGVLGLVAGVGLIMKRTWTLPVSIGWAIATTWAATVASFAFHDPTFKEQGTLAGVSSAFLATILIDAFVIWVVRSTLKTESQPAGAVVSPPGA